jgi:dynein heavy chain
MLNPIIYGDFLTLDPGVDMIDQWRLYEDCVDYERIKPQWVKILDVYNEENPPMELVMFDQALYHIVAVSRIFRLPRGNALMIGVGGSGKTSTCRLAAFSSGMKMFTLTLSRNYGLDSMLENFREL